MKLPTTLLKFIIGCSTGDDDGGGWFWDEKSYWCCATRGTWRLLFPGEVRMVPLIRIVGVVVWGIS